jgi:putative transposase
MYYWRKLSEEDREIVLAERKARNLPWHSPPHIEFEGRNRYLVTGTCFEHKSIIGKDLQRLAECEAGLLDVCKKLDSEVFAWCVLPNHYHILLQTNDLEILTNSLGKFHGTSSFEWNGEDNARGRKVWFRCFSRSIRSDRHFWVSMNYVHQNPIHHGYVDQWQDWLFSSAATYLEEFGREKASEIWRKYPILDYGKKWDV